MTDPKALQSEQDIVEQFNRFLDGVVKAASESPAALAAAVNGMLNYVSSALIQSLSSKDERVKLAELFLTGTTTLPIFELQAIADNIDNHLQGLALGNRNTAQIAMSMIHGEPSVNDVSVLKKTGQALDKIINTVNSFNLSIKDNLNPKDNAKVDILKNDNVSPTESGPVTPTPISGMKTPTLRRGGRGN